MPIIVMKLKIFWERYRAQRWAPTAGARLPLEGKTPKPFQPLTHEESRAVLEDATQWLIDQTRTMLTMPDGLAKERRWAELRARHKSLVLDSLRLARDQAG